MRVYSGTELTYLQNRQGYIARILLWVRPRNPATNTRVGMGFWTGEFDAVFTIGGAERTYTSGGLTEIDPIVMQAGLLVRMQHITLSPLVASVAQLLRGYDAWRAPVEIHRALFDTDTMALIAEPRRIWKGVIDRTPIQTPAIGGESSVQATLSSAAETLTHGLSVTRSHAVQKQIGGDGFYRYKDVSGTVPVSWGEERARVPGTGSGSGGGRSHGGHTGGNTYNSSAFDHTSR